MSRHTTAAPRRFEVLVLVLLAGLGGLVLSATIGDRTANGAVPTGTITHRPPPTAGVLGREVCAGAGYLCAGLAERDEPRVLRWPDDTRTIRVGVPLPSGLEPARARALQDAVAAGILAWQDKPFRIQIDRTGFGEPDFVVRWSTLLEGNQLGRTRTRWVREADGTTGMRVTELIVVHRDPYDATRPLNPASVQLTAAHEMGHALGLPHSDSERDVMYPTNTATALSARDYTTMSALYRLENGALLELEQAAADD
ncbi:MAG TPA: matrixin family metalloprotease [Longimicrobiales bacterium]|nr:matrixin family metalloprotease [Longimicrobiales bacterium]